VAETVRNDIVETFGVPPERVVMIPTARDAGLVSPKIGRLAIRKELGIPPEVPVIISLGALTWEKDPLAHLEVTATVLRSFPECRHLVVGEGPLRSAVEERLRELSLQGRVLMLGPRQDVGDLLAASDVMLLASRIEGMPGAVIEAGFAGLPVAAYSVAGVPELIVDGVTGHLVAPGDIDDLSSRVVQLLENEDMRRAFGNAARERSLDKFEIGVIAPRYFALYESLLTPIGAGVPRP
jgi:glycosyltransferase involved in cell wall biosynthesis